MRTTTITEAKNQLSRLLDRVRAGESIVILDRGIPVARIEPVAGHHSDDGRLSRLERAGMVEVGRAAPPVNRMRSPGPPLRPGSSAVAALLEERRSGR
jgi:prevent-host-death family protein